jgi:peptidoglycan/LPS O-acetylase OafA/YrhL
MIEKKQRERIFGLDLVRVLANLFILFAHTEWIYPRSSGLVSKIKDVLGFIGIEVFFVISGFFVGQTLYAIYCNSESKLNQLLLFFKRRAIRILPNYYLALIINLGIVLYFNLEKVEVGRYFLLLQNAVTAPSYFFNESWSIPVKEWSYILLVIVLLVIAAIKKNKFVKLKFVSVVMLLTFFFIWTKMMYHSEHASSNLYDWNASLHKVVLYRMDSVLIGVLCAVMYVEFSTLWTKSRYWTFVLGAVSIALLIGCMKQFSIVTFPFFWNILLLPLLSVAIALTLPFFSEWKTKWVIGKVPIQLMSKMSYAIYLLHYSIILFLLKQWVDTSQFSMNQLHLFTLFYFALTFALSYLMYTWYEKPISKYR